MSDRNFDPREIIRMQHEIARMPHEIASKAKEKFPEYFKEISSEETYEVINDIDTTITRGGEYPMLSDEAGNLGIPKDEQIKIAQHFKEDFNDLLTLIEQYNAIKF